MCTGIPFVPSLSPCSGLRLTDGWIAAGVAAFCLVVSIALVFVCCYVMWDGHPMGICCPDFYRHTVPRLA